MILRSTLPSFGCNRSVRMRNGNEADKNSVDELIEHGWYRRVCDQ